MTAGSPPDLASTARWMQDALVGRRGRPASGRGVDEVVAPSPRLTPAECLAVYQRSYTARLLECFRAEYPALRHAVGEDAFSAFALGYLRRHPSRSPTLGRLAGGFAGYLAASRPGAGAPASSREAWPEVLIDIARVERAVFEVYDGPGHEPDGAPGADAILGRPLADDRLHVAPVVCLRLLELRFPVHTYVAAARRGDRPPLPAEAPTFLAVTRRDHAVRFVTLPRPEFELLRAISGDEPLAAALSRLTPPVRPDHRSIEWRARLCHLADEGLLARIEIRPPA